MSEPTRPLEGPRSAERRHSRRVPAAAGDSAPAGAAGAGTSQQPFTSMAQAEQTAHQMPASSDVVAHLAEGTYRLTRPMTFAQECAGIRFHRIDRPWQQGQEACGLVAALGSHECPGDAGSPDRAQRRGAEAFGGSSAVFPERNQRRDMRAGQRLPFRKRHRLQSASGAALARRPARRKS